MFRNSGPPGSIVKQRPLADSLGCAAPREAQDWEESTVCRGMRSRAGQQDCSNLWLYCAQSEKRWVPAQSHCLPQQIIFYIGHGELGGPAVLVSRNLFRPSLPSASWKEVEGQPGLRLFGRPLSDYYAYSPVREQDAYSILISRIFHHRKDSFITMENLLASWVFWTPLLDSLAHEVPRLYPGGAENGHLLDFEFSGSHLSFSQPPLEQLVLGPDSAPMPSDFQVLRAKYTEAAR